MRARRRCGWIAALGLLLLSGEVPSARGQYARYPSVGYGIGTGQIGAGYGSSVGYGFGGPRSGYNTGYGHYYRPNVYVPPARTVTNFGPLYSAITSLPGWSGGGVPRRTVRRRPVEPPVPTLDNDGKILWPSTIPDDPTSTAMRKDAEAAVSGVVQESKSTGHASIRPVLAAKRKLSDYERKILPAIKGRNVTDGDELERFFVDLNRNLDAMNSVY